MDVMDEMGVSNYGILLSEKDSFIFPNALAPELRKLTDPDRVFRVPDYSGATKEERSQRIEQIIRIARTHGYNSVFAGYGFMAEDEEMVSSLEKAGLNFIGPCSRTQRSAGRKDEAKRTALGVDVSVTPGIDNATTLTLLRKYPEPEQLIKLCDSEGLAVQADLLENPDTSIERRAELVLAASYDKGIDLFTIEELAEEVRHQVEVLNGQHPQNRIRLKAIQGGGGKGQRILKAPSEFKGSNKQKLQAAAAPAPDLVREILNEVKSNGIGDNKNVLIELNIETTRHQEIQVVGNGDWCITMGGRDCSLQMHEQKLLEVSTTVEELNEAINAADLAGRNAEAETLRKDLEILIDMESEAARFGKAVGLDSVSTFECIVDGPNHYFMEMNTRVQVEHRVTELCYKLKFSDPDDPNDFFIVESIIELMMLLACHGSRLPVPERIVREKGSLEARLNATNHALQPNAGGTIEYWSNAIEGEIRDDQGICVHNPDTDVFMKYQLAGAYDSNIALLLTTGDDRNNSYRRMAEVLRRTDLRGKDLATNLEFHYGLVNWFIGENVHARPTTGFIVPYLTAVGKLKQAADQLDLAYCFNQIRTRYLANADDKSRAAYTEALDRKLGLLLRPLEKLFAEPHLLAGWLSTNKSNLFTEDQQVVWGKNPIEVLADTYHFLNMDYVAGEPAAYMIWSHDNDLLQNALEFYRQLKTELNITEYPQLEEAIQASRSKKFSKSRWQEIRAAHAGYQCGMEIMTVLLYLAEKTGFHGLRVNEDLSINIPDELRSEDLQEAMSKMLAPPPVAGTGEILAQSGGMFYSREAPEMDPFVEQGSHFGEGQPLYIIEVMKMFNKVYAPFSGTIDQVLVDTDGVIIKKGQPLFKVSPDEETEHVSEESVLAIQRKSSEAFLATVT
jgi:acetyl/propionyl-CoA carboxylase alpha subunit